VIVSPVVAGVLALRQVRVYSSAGSDTTTSLSSKSVFNVLYHVACSLTRPSQSGIPITLYKPPTDTSSLSFNLREFVYKDIDTIDYGGSKIRFDPLGVDNTYNHNQAQTIRLVQTSSFAIAESGLIFLMKGSVILSALMSFADGSDVRAIYTSKVQTNNAGNSFHTPNPGLVPLTDFNPEPDQDEFGSILEAFEEYLRTGDPLICERYSYDPEVGLPSLDYIQALKTLPWDKLTVTLEEAVVCFKLHNILVENTNIARVVKMAEKITSQITDGTFNSQQEYGVFSNEDDTENAITTVSQSTELSKPLEPFKNNGKLGMALYNVSNKGANTTEALFYNDEGELFRMFKDNEAIVVMAIAGAYTAGFSLVVGLPPLPISAAVATAGYQALNYVWHAFKTTPIPKETIKTVFASVYSVLPEKTYLWSTTGWIINGVYTEIAKPVTVNLLVGARDKPWAVVATAVAAGTTFYYRKEIIKYGGSAAGLALVVAGGLALLDSGILTSRNIRGIKRKLKTKFNKNK
jgi:hypothetical protein